MRLVRPIILIGLTALSVEINTNFFVLCSKAKSAKKVVAKKVVKPVKKVVKAAKKVTKAPAKKVVAKKVVREKHRITGVVEYLNPIHVISLLVCITALAVEFIYS